MADKSTTTAAPNSSTGTTGISSTIPNEPVTLATLNGTARPSEASEEIKDETADKPVAITTPAPGISAPADNLIPPHNVQEKPSTPVHMTPALTKLWTQTLPLTTSIHSEIWGVTLADPTTHIPTQIVLQKYLNANDQDVARAFDQLKKTLEWRREWKPRELLEKKFSKEQFGGLGYVSVYHVGGDGKSEKEEEGREEGGGWDPEKREVFTWNVYGAVKDIEKTFGNLDDFLHWRIALQERSLTAPYLPLSTATTPLTAPPFENPLGYHDPYKTTQIHDYRSLSFLRLPSAVRAASKSTIAIFSQNYPELLKEKFFVNVPGVMGFVYEIVKRFVAERTRKRFHPMSDGGRLAGEVVGWVGGRLPREYGGSGGSLSEEGGAEELSLE